VAELIGKQFRRASTASITERARGLLPHGGEAAA
jgi:hypothetical protein